MEENPNLKFPLKTRAEVLEFHKVLLQGKDTILVPLVSTSSMFSFMLVPCSCFVGSQTVTLVLTFGYKRHGDFPKRHIFYDVSGEMTNVC